MLIDSGAQVSLINNKAITNQDLINKSKKITIKSLHGSEQTIGEISANIQKNQESIPIQLQVTKNNSLNPSSYTGIIGYDIIGEKALLNGPEKLFTIKSDNKTINFELSTTETPSVNNLTTPVQDKTDIESEITRLNNITFKENHEIYPHLQFRICQAQNITQEINDTKILISKHARK